MSVKKSKNAVFMSLHGYLPELMTSHISGHMTGHILKDVPEHISGHRTGHISKDVPEHIAEHIPGVLSADFSQHTPPFSALPAERMPGVNVLKSESLFIALETQKLIDRYARQLRAMLHLLPEFPNEKVPDDVLDYYLRSTGDLIFVLHELGNLAGGEPAPACSADFSGVGNVKEK